MRWAHKADPFYFIPHSSRCFLCRHFQNGDRVAILFSSVWTFCLKIRVVFALFVRQSLSKRCASWLLLFTLTVFFDNFFAVCKNCNKVRPTQHVSLIETSLSIYLEEKRIIVIMKRTLCRYPRLASRLSSRKNSSKNFDYIKV